MDFRYGGFEVPLEDDTRPMVVRSFNVLRQYAEDEVAPAWATTTARLAPHGILVDGTCDELGRLAALVGVTTDGPPHLTLAWRLRGLERPGVVAERLPKVLIHRNVPGGGSASWPWRGTPWRPADVVARPSGRVGHQGP